ncbi:MAG TPA: hypothetical protein VKG23_13710 [Thermoanaerobaculia bacterium]|jgi:microcompartment protein CcmL/EutN|nr:hypothetical protein [Thermoanaerobaculia bacterium]
MAASRIPTPRPDEKVVAVIEIAAPETAIESKEFAEFDAKFTQFKQALDDLITNNFRGALKVKIVMKKDQEGRMSYRP